MSLGTIASFNWDTSSTSNTKVNLRLQFHLAEQYYNICIRRARSSCSVCYSPQIIHAAASGSAAATEGSSFGVSGGGGTTAPAIVSATGTTCKGITTFNAIRASAVGYGTVSIKHKKDQLLFCSFKQEGSTGLRPNVHWFRRTISVINIH